MASQGAPNTWIPYVKNKDCSQRFCSLYCLQWCYIISSPPPPPYEFPDDNSSPNVSPLVIAIIGILVSAFLLVSYYIIISKYCGHNDSARRENDDRNEELEENHNPSLHEPWHVATTGLDEAFIKSITVCKYKKGDGLIEGTDCSICLGEFQEDENVRLLPKCSHAFHVSCIDTWLRSHSNCPLCRAGIVFFGVSVPQQLPHPVAETHQGDECFQDRQRANNEDDVGVTQGIEMVVQEEQVMCADEAPKIPLRVFSDLGNLQGRGTIIEIRNERYQHIRRSVSMDHSSQSHATVPSILQMNQDEVIQVEDAGPSKPSTEISKSSSNRKKVLHCVLTSVTMRRSFSSGRLCLTSQGKVHDTISPV